MNRWSTALACKAALQVAGRYAWGSSTFPGSLPPIRNRILHRPRLHRCRKSPSGALFDFQCELFIRDSGNFRLEDCNNDDASFDTGETALLVTGLGAEDAVDALETAR